MALALQFSMVMNSVRPLQEDPRSAYIAALIQQTLEGQRAGRHGGRERLIIVRVR